jgi:RecB family exonuclease
VSDSPYSYSKLRRFWQCPQRFKLHDVDRLAPESSPESDLGRVLHETLERVVRDHVRAGRNAPLDLARARAEYWLAWSDSELTDPAAFNDGLQIVRRWVEREGIVDAHRVLGVEREFEMHIGGVRIRGAFDRVDRIGDDAIRVRDYKSGRRPPSRQEVEESLQLAIYDIAARQAWPWAKRVELGVDLLRHDKVVAFERRDEEREATRLYVKATVARIEAETEFPARLSTSCTQCDQRGHCPAYAEARVARRLPVAADAADLAAVAREREELAAWLKVVGERKDALDDVLRQRLTRQDELVVEGRRYRLVTAARKDHPVAAIRDALAAAGVDREVVSAALDASAKWTLSTRLTSTEVGS